MNKLSGAIFKIQQAGAVILVDIRVEEHPFSALLIESAQTQDWLTEGNQVEVVFKETEVTLAKNLSGLISMRNRMSCRITGIEKGSLLSKVELRFLNNRISSVITTRAIDSLQLTIGEEVEALIKANEISLMKKR